MLLINSLSCCSLRITYIFHISSLIIDNASHVSLELVKNYFILSSLIEWHDCLMTGNLLKNIDYWRIPPICYYDLHVVIFLHNSGILSLHVIFLTILNYSIFLPVSLYFFCSPSWIFWLFLSLDLRSADINEELSM